MSHTQAAATDEKKPTLIQQKEIQGIRSKLECFGGPEGTREDFAVVNIAWKKRRVKMAPLLDIWMGENVEGRHTSGGLVVIVIQISFRDLPALSNTQTHLSGLLNLEAEKICSRDRCVLVVVVVWIWRPET